MSRADFMRKLAELLTDVSPAEREEAIQYYNDYFDDAGAENEQSVIASLGSPEQLARTIRAGLSDGGNMGEFTEKGFSGYETGKNNEVLNPGQTGTGSRDEGQYFAGGAGSNTGSAANSGNAYGYRQWNSGGNPYRSQNDNNGYQNAYTNGAEPGNAVQKREKRKLSGGAIVLIILLCIIAAPVVLSLAGGLLGGAFGIFGGLIGCVFGLGLTSVILIVVGIGVFVYGIGLLFGLPLGGLCMMGGGMICIAIGLFFLWLVALICGMLIPAIVRGIVKLFHIIFHRGGASA